MSLKSITTHREYYRFSDRVISPTVQYIALVRAKVTELWPFEVFDTAAAPLKCVQFRFSGVTIIMPEQRLCQVWYQSNVWPLWPSGSSTLAWVVQHVALRGP